MTELKMDKIIDMELSLNKKVEIELPKFKEKICRILWVKKNNFGISLSGYGITIDGNIDKIKSDIKIKYQGEIGKSDFKIISYK